MKKKCELCSCVARMYCLSDKASLCWNCDTRVHSANFIVTKHTRTLLCHACQSPTPWTGSGRKLSPTVSLCEACVGRSGRNMGDDRENDDDDEADREEKEDDGENQVVPMILPP